MMGDFELQDVIYENPLATPDDIAGWRMEGDGAVSFPLGRMRMENTRDPQEGQAANIVHWCPEQVPDNVAISWDFYPIREPGLAILFFAATGRNGEDVLSPDLATRTGEYDQYHHGDLNALHVSYFRRKHPRERAFQTCNLRKSYGFHLVCQGADPLPSVPDARPPYRVQVIKAGPVARFAINDLELFRWLDDGESYGDVLAGGKIGFRQMAPLIAEYADLRVHHIRIEE
jgi:hypothetical protein